MRVCSYCHLLLADSDSVCPHDGAETRTAEVPPVPPQLHERFTSPEPYARGQTGTCYLATQQPSGYRGVLKVIPLAGVEASERVRLKRELRKQTQLSHDGLPRIIDGGELGQQLWLFREHVQGESLAQRIRRLGKLEPGEALAITAQIASALDELQRNGLLHRDVKPGHIIVPVGNQSAVTAKLIDAGVAARLPTGSVFGLLGTPAYISPEQVAGKLVSFRSDLYALGCVLFEMLSGQPPFPDHDVQAVLEAHKSNPPPELELELPHQARSLLAALLAKEPRQRPFSAQQVRRTLEPVLPAGTLLPAIGTRAPARAQPAARKAGAPPARPATTEILEDIDLEEIPLARTDGPKTLHLSDAEVDELELGADGAPSTEGAAASAQSAAGTAERVTPVGGGEPGQEAAAAAAASVRDAITHDPDAANAGDSSQHSIEVIVGVGSEASLPAVAPGRRSVDFDVESLFDDASVPAAEEPASLHDAAPTQLFRPRSDEAVAAGNAASAAVAKHASSGHVAPDPEGTVMTARRPQKRRAALPWVLGLGIAVGLAALLVRGRHAPHQPASSDAPAATAASAKPSPAVDKAEPPPPPSPGSAQASPGTTPANAAPSPSGQPVAANPSAPPAAAAAHPTDPAATPKAEPQPPTHGDSAAAQPVAHPSEPAASAQLPGSAAKADRPAVLPAATAAGSSKSATDRSAELAAANAAGRSQSGGGDGKIGAAKAPRDDRVSKADELKAQGREHYQAGRFREAAAAYERATGLNPSDAGAFAGLAASRLAAGDPAAAVQAYSRAVRLQPDSSGFHAALGRAYLQKGDRDRARSAYQHALELNPNNAAAKTALAQLK
jgi:Flp pilus assembly protein TadD